MDVNQITAPVAKKPLYRQLYAQVLFAIFLGVVVGVVRKVR